jgi:hypothetical protein
MSIDGKSREGYPNGLDTEKPCTVPARLVRAGRWNLLAVRVYDAGGAGGFRDGPPVLSLASERHRVLVPTTEEPLAALGQRPFTAEATDKRPRALETALDAGSGPDHEWGTYEVIALDANPAPSG